MTDTSRSTPIETQSFAVLDAAGLPVPATTPESTASLIAQLHETIDRLRTELDVARGEQITDGSDERLAAFWNRAERIATAAGFCEEYDRIAEGLNGPRRERDWEVRLEVTVTLTTYQTITARDLDTAIEEAEQNLSLGVIVDEIRAQEPAYTVTDRDGEEDEG